MNIEAGCSPRRARLSTLSKGDSPRWVLPSAVAGCPQLPTRKHTKVGFEEQVMAIAEMPHSDHRNLPTSEIEPYRVSRRV